MKRKRKVKLKEIMRLYFEYEIDSIPVVDSNHKLKGLINRNDLISDAVDNTFIEKNFVSVSKKYIKQPDEKNFLNYVSNIPVDLEFPVINLQGEKIGVWNKKDILNAYYEINKNSLIAGKEEKVENGMVKIRYDTILNALPENVLLVNNENEIVFANKFFLKNLNFKKEILLNQRINEILPDIVIEYKAKNLYPKKYNYTYNHKNWLYYIVKVNKNYVLYFFEFASKKVDTQVELNFSNSSEPLNRLISKSEKEIIKAALIESEWNITRAAAILKIPRQTLQYKILKYKIKENEI